MRSFYKYGFYCELISNGVVIDLVSGQHATSEYFTVAFGRKLSLFWGLIVSIQELTAPKKFSTYSEAFSYYKNESSLYMSDVELTPKSRENIYAKLYLTKERIFV